MLFSRTEAIFNRRGAIKLESIKNRFWGVWVTSISIKYISLFEKNFGTLHFCFYHIEQLGKQRTADTVRTLFFLLEVSWRGRAAVGGKGLNPRMWITHKLYLVEPLASLSFKGDQYSFWGRWERKGKGGEGLAWEGGLWLFWNWLCAAHPVPSQWGHGDRTLPSGGPRTGMEAEVPQMSHPPGLIS